MVRKNADPTQTTLADVVNAINAMRLDLGERIDGVSDRVDLLSTKVDRHYNELLARDRKLQARVTRLEQRKK